MCFSNQIRTNYLDLAMPIKIQSNSFRFLVITSLTLLSSLGRSQDLQVVPQRPETWPQVYRGDTLLIKWNIPESLTKFRRNLGINGELNELKKAKDSLILVIDESMHLKLILEKGSLFRAEEKFIEVVSRGAINWAQSDQYKFEIPYSDVFNSEISLTDIFSQIDILLRRSGFITDDENRMLSSGSYIIKTNFIENSQFSPNQILKNYVSYMSYLVELKKFNHTVVSGNILIKRPTKILCVIKPIIKYRRRLEPGNYMDLSSSENTNMYVESCNRLYHDLKREFISK